LNRIVRPGVDSARKRSEDNVFFVWTDLDRLFVSAVSAAALGVGTH
jgi:hypothetical protein